MNKNEQFEEDTLRKYINAGGIEKAPEGFTSKTMTRIQIETGSSKVSTGSLFKSPVPLVSFLITVALIAAVIFIPGGSSDTIGQSVVKYLGTLDISLPQVDFSSLPQLNLPGWFLYAFLGILFLAFFDKALFGIFHKERK
jgi:hypothetical protein